MEAAIKSYKQALHLRPEFPEATCNLLHTLQVMLQFHLYFPWFLVKQKGHELYIFTGSMDCIKDDPVSTLKKGFTHLNLALFYFFNYSV